MRPPAPVPLTLVRSMLFSRAMRRTSGDNGPAASPGSSGAAGAAGAAGAGVVAFATGGSGAAAGFTAGAAAGAPAPSEMRATTVLIPTVLPSSTSTSDSVPAAGDGISVSTLSVEIS